MERNWYKTVSIDHKFFKKPKKPQTEMKFLNFFLERYTFWNEEHFHTLEITKTILDDSGCYTASARNEHGSVSCRCNLVVDKGIRAYVAPEFITELEVARSVKLGGELRLTAQVEAYPSVGVVW